MENLGTKTSEESSRGNDFLPDKEHATATYFHSTGAILLRKIEEGIYPEAFSENIREIMRELEDILKSLGTEQDPAMIQELVIGAASMAAGLGEMRHNLLLAHSADTAESAETHSIAGLLLGLELRLMESLPLIGMEKTPQEGIRALEREFKKNQSTAYARLAAVFGAKVREKVESSVRSFLERLAGLIPGAEVKRIADISSRQIGNLVALMSTVGIGFLAFGCRSRETFTGHDYEGPKYEKVDSSVEIEVNKEAVEIRREDIGTIRIVPLAEIEKIETDAEPNRLFEKLAAVDTRIEGRGVHYEVLNPELFKKTVEDDACQLAERLFGKKLEEISSPLEFIKLVNGVVENRISYNRAAIQIGSPEWNKLNEMPLDTLYLNYRKGICVNYGALVKLVGDTLREGGLVPGAKGTAIGEAHSAVEEHAWNVWYLNPEGSDDVVVVSFTDATGDDAAGMSLDTASLNARDPSYGSVKWLISSQGNSQVRNSENLFTLGEIEDITEKLVQEKIGGLDQIYMVKFLQMQSFARAQAYFRDFQGLMVQDQGMGTDHLNEERSLISRRAQENLWKTINMSIYLYSVAKALKGDKQAESVIPFQLSKSASTLFDFYKTHGKIEDAKTLIRILERSDVPQEEYAELRPRLREWEAETTDN